MWNDFRWNDDGHSIVIHSKDFVCRNLRGAESLFRTKHWHSFIRQMNLYGFKRVFNTNPCGACQSVNTQEVVFENPNFQRGNFGGLRHILRVVKKDENADPAQEASIIVLNTVKGRD
jgi:hypothetical protein